MNIVARGGQRNAFPAKAAFCPSGRFVPEDLLCELRHQPACPSSGK
jgi:hypothetical protein